jgi:hypothetical protein
LGRNKRIPKEIAAVKTAEGNQWKTEDGRRKMNKLAIHLSFSVFRQHQVDARSKNYQVLRGGLNNEFNN